MNKHILLSAAALLGSCLPLAAQNCGIQPTSAHIIGTAEQHESQRITAKIQEMPNGDLILTSSDVNVSNGSIMHATVMRVDESGHVVWRKTYGNNTSHTNDVYLHNDTLYVLYGDVDLPHVMQLDPATGDWLAENEYFSLTWRSDNAWNITENNDGNLLISGYVNTEATTNNYGYDAQLALLDEHNEINWQYQYGQMGGVYYDGIWESHVVDTTIYALGFMRVGSSVGNVDAFLMQTDMNGNIVKNTLIDAGIDNNYYVKSIITSDQHLLVVGYSIINGTSEQVHAVKMTLDGTVVWARILGGTGNERLHGVVEKDNNEYVLVGHTNSPSLSSGMNDALIIYLDATTGALNKALTVGEPTSNESLSSVSPLSNGGFATVGMTSYYGNNDILLYRLDACFSGFCSSMDVTDSLYNDTLAITTTDITATTHRYALGTRTPLTSGEIADSLLVADTTLCSDSGYIPPVIDGIMDEVHITTVYPNPSHDGVFTIDLHDHNAASYYVVNQLGEIVQSGTPMGSHIFRITLSDIPKGLYYLMLQDGQTTSTHKLMYR